LDGNGLPPHAFEAIVLSTATDDEIAQVIYDNGHTGIPSHGSSSGTATDEDGVEHVERFTRVTERDVYLEFDLVVGDDFNLVVFQSAVALACDEEHDVADAVRRARMISLALTVQGVEDVAAVRLGFTVSPTGTGNLVIGRAEIARFDAGRIDVTEV
jgi:hypothetical protein